MNNTRLSECPEINTRLKAHAEVIVEGVLESKDSHYIGYLFTPNNWGDSVKVGLYCEGEDEINKTHFEYYYDFSSVKFYKLI